MANVPVVGAVLIWAREFRGFSLDEAALRTGLPLDELRAFEEELLQPSLSKFEKIASAYHLPAATLFRRTPPIEPKEPSDFRTLEGAANQKSFEYRVALSNVRTLQSTLRLLRIEDQEFQNVELRRYHFEADPFKQGEAERKEIGVSVQRQLEWKSAEAFNHWRALIERLGIAVYLQKFLTSDCRGWSMADADAPPAIIVNKEDRFDTARAFTLIHEYAHLLIRRPGISDQDSRNPTEAFCNRFAGAFLMPIEALRQLLEGWPDKPEEQEWKIDTVRTAAARLKVSAQALAIRLEELRRAPKGFNTIFKVTPVERKPAKQSKKQIKVDHATIRLSEIGARYTQSVIGALDREVIDSVHASQALGLNPAKLQKARAYIERYQSLAGAG
jgi:Zn-dependent peptidase ImmA (M78 family)/transcriptional regulator with XRE-family HTH domain